MTRVVGAPMGRGQRWNPANLRMLRQAFGMSPEAFAERVGSVSTSTVQRWENGRHVPLIHHLEAIADAFDIDLAVFFAPANPGRSRRRKARGEHRPLPGQMELLPSGRRVTSWVARRSAHHPLRGRHQPGRRLAGERRDAGLLGGAAQSPRQADAEAGQRQRQAAQHQR